jgi:hypothetical protein
MTPKRLALEQRQAAAFALRLQGGGWEQIARSLKKKGEAGDLVVPRGYDGWSVQRDVMGYLVGRSTPTDEEIDVARQLWIERLRELLKALWPLGKRGELFAIDRILAILSQEAKLTPGLFPKDGQVDVNVRGKLGVGGVDEQGEVAGPVVVNIEWPDVPLDNTVGFADPGDPATDIEIAKMLKSALGAEIGSEAAELVLAYLAGVTERRRAEASMTTPDGSEQAASEVAAMLGAFE